MLRVVHMLNKLVENDNTYNSIIATECKYYILDHHGKNPLHILLALNILYNLVSDYEYRIVLGDSIDVFLCLV